MARYKLRCTIHGMTFQRYGMLTSDLSLVLDVLGLPRIPLSLSANKKPVSEERTDTKGPDEQISLP